METSSADVDFLSGVRIVDFTQFEAGPSCTEALAWMGADVVKIENPQLGDPGRRLRPGKPDTDPYYFHVFNANKKSITVNLKSPRGLALVKDMLRKADVCVENFAPGTIERLGLGYDVVRELNPGIIYASGQRVRRRQPVRKEPGVRHDRAGLRRHVQRHRRSGRTADAAGHFARRHRHRHADGDHHRSARCSSGRSTGKGHRLQVAMQDAIMHYMRINFATQGLTGKPAQRGGSKVVGVNNAPMGLYPCTPGGPNDYVYIMTSRANPDHWDRLLKLVGREDLIGDKRYATPADRVEREAEVDEIIAAWTRQHTKHEAMNAVGECRHSGGRGAGYDGAAERCRASSVAASCRRCIIRCIGDFKMPAWPVRVDGKPPRVETSPVLGQHTGEVLQAWLGMSAGDVETLRGEGAVA